jgi:hypothetical protein
MYVRLEREAVEAGLLDSSQVLLEGVAKSYPQGMFKPPVQAVRGIWVGVPTGQCFGLLGVNGAGKTTTFRSALPPRVWRTATTHCRQALHRRAAVKRGAPQHLMPSAAAEYHHYALLQSNALTLSRRAPASAMGRLAAPPAHQPQTFHWAPLQWRSSFLSLRTAPATTRCRRAYIMGAPATGLAMTPTSASRQQGVHSPPSRPHHGTNTRPQTLIDNCAVLGHLVVAPGPLCAPRPRRPPAADVLLGRPSNDAPVLKPAYSNRQSLRQPAAAPAAWQATSRRCTTHAPITPTATPLPAIQLPPRTSDQLVLKPRGWK